MAIWEPITRILTSTKLLGGNDAAPLNEPLVNIENNFNALHGLLHVGRFGTNQNVPLGAPKYNTNARWGARALPNIGWEQVDVTDGGGLLFPLPPFPLASGSNGAYLRGAALRVNAGTGRAGLPGTMPYFALWKADNTDSGTMDLVAGMNDPAGDLGTYETVRTVSFSGLDVECDGGVNSWFLQVRGETGANAQVGYNLLSLVLTFGATG